MSQVLALPFTLSRSDSVVGWEVISTTERVHGLLLLDGNRLVIQWRVSRATQRVGMEIRTEHELEPVREIVIPLEALAGAKVRWTWWRWPPSRYLVLTGADLRAFEEIAGSSGIGMPHPAELYLQLRRSDFLAAREFAGELELAIADRALREAEAPPPIPGTTDPSPNPEQVSGGG